MSKKLLRGYAVHICIYGFCNKNAVETSPSSIIETLAVYPAGAGCLVSLAFRERCRSCPQRYHDLLMQTLGHKPVLNATQWTIFWTCGLISPEARSNQQPPHAMHRSLGEVAAEGQVDPSQTDEEPLYLQALVALLLTCQQWVVELQAVVDAAELLLF